MSIFECTRSYIIYDKAAEQFQKENNFFPLMYHLIPFCVHFPVKLTLGEKIYTHFFIEFRVSNIEKESAHGFMFYADRSGSVFMFDEAILWYLGPAECKGIGGKPGVNGLA